MDFRLTEEQEMVRDSARKFGKRWAPKMDELHRRAVEDGEFDRTFFTDLAEAGFAGALIPEEWGGSGMGLTPLAIAMETMAIEGVGSAMLMLTQMNALCILRAGPDELRQKYLPPVAAGELVMAFAITEPDAGSNSFRMATVAERRGDDIVLNGTKTFITGADICDKILLIARSMPHEERKAKEMPKTAGFNVVVVDPKAKGFSMTEVPTRGIEGLKQWTLHFDDVICDDVVGDEHMGIIPMFDVLNAERTLAAAAALGMTERLLLKAVEYAKDRKVFGDRAIGSYQAIQHPLAEIKAELEAVRLLFYKCATMFDQGARPMEIGPYATMCKYLAGELAIKAADQALQTFGGSGFSSETGMIDAYVNARLLRTAPISREMILNQVAEHVLGLPRSY
ncbi:MAG: acyl-CoA/acyl-ACP dehydrogenase [Sandaracinaceae bacterium]|nr:acyl-CoA/acyl-ACP dehydrogenase [Sandaracinaceae bacterium]